MACLELVRKLLSLLGKVANVRHITINLWISVVWCSQCVPWIWLFLVQNQEQRIHYIIAGLGNQLTHLYIHIHILYIIYYIYIYIIKYYMHDSFWFYVWTNVTRTGQFSRNSMEFSRLGEVPLAEQWEPSRGPHANGGYNLVEGSVLPVATTRAGLSVPGIHRHLRKKEIK